ncbi:MAG: Na+ dependent nucleoside transporter, partial [Tannerellaceae bacterium]|nr:Na+ dependent nucleoside transporter [Tannerellaceae bacterium]
MIGSEGFSVESLLRGMLGMLAVMAVCYLMSFNRRRIDWRLIGVGLSLQVALALSVLYVPFVGSLFEWAGRAFVKLMDFTHEGLVFLLGPYAERANGFSFLLHSLPVIVFFSAIVSVLYHWGVVQKVVGALSWALRRMMNISGAEGLVAAGNIFMGMTESPVLIKNYLPGMNRSEIFLVMVSGMGTIAGSVMGTYISMLAGDSPVERVMFAKHLLSASVMAAPGAIVIAKMLCPQTEAIGRE